MKLTELYQSAYNHKPLPLQTSKYKVACVNAVLQRLPLNLAELVHLWNFYFYLRIPSFRHAVISGATCGLLDSTNGTRSRASRITQNSSVAK